MSRLSQEEEEEEEEVEDEEPALDPAQLLNLAQTHLRLRNYSLTRQYSLELLSSDTTTTRRSHRATATQLLTISDILSATDTTTINHYSILQLDSFSSDPNLIRTHFKKLLFILDPIRHSSPLAQLALDFANAAHDCLSDPVKKRVFDSELMNCLNSVALTRNGGNDRGFWTFCPYCFYVYEYDRVYEGCCLRCQNVACRRAFHGVALASLPKMELDKGRYFGCYGYFPLGFQPGKNGDDRRAMFQNWSPIVSMFPSHNANDINLNDNNNYNNADFIEILDDSDESDAPVQGAGEGNVGINRPQGMRRKSVARRKRKSSAGDASTSNGSASKEGLFSEEGADFVQEFGGGRAERAVVGDLNEVDMAFFEGDGEVFVELGSDDAPL